MRSAVEIVKGRYGLASSWGFPCCPERFQHAEVAAAWCILLVYTMAIAAHRVNVREARRSFRQLLAWVEAGQEVILLRRDVEVGRIVGPARERAALPSLAKFRAQIRVSGKPMSQTVIARRGNERA